MYMSVCLLVSIYTGLWTPCYVSTGLWTPEYVFTGLWTPDYVSTGLWTPDYVSIGLWTPDYVSTGLWTPEYVSTGLWTPDYVSTGLWTPEYVSTGLWTHDYVSTGLWTPDYVSTGLWTPDYVSTGLWTTDYLSDIWVFSIPLRCTKFYWQLAYSCTFYLLSAMDSNGGPDGARQRNGEWSPFVSVHVITQEISALRNFTRRQLLTFNSWLTFVYRSGVVYFHSNYRNAISTLTSLVHACINNSQLSYITITAYMYTNSVCISRSWSKISIQHSDWTYV